MQCRMTMVANGVDVVDKVQTVSPRRLMGNLAFQRALASYKITSSAQEPSLGVDNGSFEAAPDDPAPSALAEAAAEVIFSHFT